MVVAYFQWIPVPFDRLLWWFLLYLDMVAPFSVIVLPKWRPEWVRWAASLGLPPIYSIIFLDSRVTTATVGLTVAVAAVAAIFFRPPAMLENQLLPISIANTLIVMSNSLAILQALGRIQQVLKALQQAAAKEQALAATTGSLSERRPPA